MPALRIRAHLALLGALAASLICAASAAGADRRATIERLTGSGHYEITLDDLDDEFGPLSYTSQRFDWRIAGSPRLTLKLPESRKARLRVPIEMHVVSTGNGIYFDLASSPPRTIQYTCRADQTYTTRSLVEVTRRARSWRVTLTPATQLESGATTCDNVSPSDVLWAWPTGTTWFTTSMRQEQPLTVTRAGRANLSYSSTDKKKDCTEVPGVTYPCTETLSWNSKLRLANAHRRARH